MFLQPPASLQQLIPTPSLQEGLASWVPHLASWALDLANWALDLAS